ncbi:hypothetical protein C6P44_001456 [Monosporozyma unispora]|nr:hypothetical protein C6P44_001456 [Kazachstania unispora]
MFALPDELLELIVQQNDDSIRTLISWSLLSPRIQKLVSKEVGIITIQDGVQAPLENLLGYQCLIDNKTIPNHLDINSDEIDDEYIMTEEQSFTYFISHFNNLLIIIESSRPYSERLANTLTRIANSCHIGVNICVFYKTHTNFLSKLYFKPFKIILPNISLTELYLFGNNNLLASENNLIDIDTLFDTVHIEQIKTIYSLDIVDDSKQFNAPELTTIKKINYNDSVNIGYFLRHCTNIKNIDYLKFPIYIHYEGKYTFNLPHCERITLNEFNNNVSYPIINGVKVTQKLTLKPTLRSPDPIFQNLYFPQITTLDLPISDFKVVTFKNCDFTQVRNLNIEACMVPWDNLYLLKNFDEKEVKLNVTLKLTDWQQLEWLRSCPYKIENLQIRGSMIHLLPAYTYSHPSLISASVDQSLSLNGLNNANKIETITVHVDSLEQCYLIQGLLTSDNLDFTKSSLNIIIHESNFRNSITENRNSKLNQDVPLQVNSIKHLTILLLDQNISDHPLSHGENILYGETIDIPKMENKLFNTDNPLRYKEDTKPLVDTISPSQFRKNSLAGLPSHEARKQSIISFDSLSPRLMDTTSERRRSSLDSVSLFSNLHYVYNNEYAIDDSSESNDLVTLELQGTICPSIITVNLNSIESSIFQFDGLLNESKIALLQIWFAPDTHLTNYEALVLNLANKIINMIHYPYSQSSNLPSFQKLQLLVDITQIYEKFEVPITFETLASDINYTLARKGRFLDFIKFTPKDMELIETSPNFSICLKV